MKAILVLVVPVLVLGAGKGGAVRVPVAVRPLGAVYAPPPSTRPLGGVTTPRRKNTGTSTPSYYGPVYYIPGAYDSYSDYSGYGAQQAAPPPPVIVNQYFGTQGSSVPDAYNVADAEPRVQEALVPGDPLTPAQNYYLIRYKDRNTFSALTYWLEGDTLHYVTTDNKHNQASLDLIDLDQTYKLNADNSVPFSIPGR